jgi:uncharacterized repeat protein (TIGR03803 family)
MGSMRVRYSMKRIPRVLAVVTVLVGAAWATGKEQVIYSFGGGTDGEYTDTELVVDGAGNLYGTSVQGGTFGGGTVFRLSPSGSGWTHSVLYNFTGGADGGEPYKGVTLDAHGDLYGTAVTGGGGSCEGGCGVVYKLTNSGGVWTQSVLHAFTGGSDGSGPGSPVILDAHGNLYGTTPTGGAKGFGVVYEVKRGADEIWNLKVLHTFTGGIDGLGGSASRMLLDSAGNFYGVNTVGGAHGFGNVFALTFNSGKWYFMTLYSFQDQPDGASPYGGLIVDKDGSLYGTTYYAGANDVGTVYKLTRANGSWTESVIYSFKGGSDGDSPISTLVADARGNLYGTTSDGGAAKCGCGTIFKLARGSGGTWTEIVAYRFPGAPEAAFAYNGMVSDGKGNFFGATVHGGTGNDGAIYQFTP